ncbi:hypothetical protein MTR67_049391 [Solanum verrucosum]|uniref:NB-ARC domain-containing protein n=1 Tax=Solanum verrucosum TaxID=315347 RepID=A0AAF0V3C3_SOLVR|nr:hypothetical protein MTR67_049391 [Solanum verrucosum]
MQLHPKSGKKIESLLQKVSLLQGFFDDTGKDHEDIKCLEGIIRDVSCKAEDLVEEIMFEYSSSSSLKKNAIKFLGVNRVLFRKIKSIEAAITSVYNDISAIKGRSTPSSSVNGCSRDVTQTLSSQKDVVVGLDDDFLLIADKLTGYPDKLDVVVIFGMGGIGKTTLAKRIFNDKLIEEHFYVRAWITVSEQYKVRNMLLDLLGCTSKVPFIMDEMENEELAERLYKSLKGQRYLIVMDDVWYTEAWDDVRRYFPNDKNGSRVMVTSRVMKVARFINPLNPPHQMRFLTVDESWKLLQKKILGLDDPSFCCDYEMERIGMQISKKCKGLPLAIVMVAGILSKESATASKWSDVAENIHSSFVTEESREFLDILALSYNHLPHHLKACFLYMGAFPEDVEIPVWRLIRLWTAEGFIKLESPKTLEFVAQEYLQELIDRSLIIVSKRSYDNRVKTCSIHDILRNFCQEEAKQEKLLHVVRNSFLLWEDARVLGNLPNLEVLKLKDFSFQGPEWETDEEGFHRLKYLLVESRDLVVWKQASTDSYPFPVLQHLVLRFCYKLKEIPYEIGDIPSLQVIELHSCSPYATRLARMIQKEQIDSGNSCLEVFIHPAR